MLQIWPVRSTTCSGSEHCLRARLWADDLTSFAAADMAQTGIAWQALLAQGGWTGSRSQLADRLHNPVGFSRWVTTRGLLPSPPLAVRRRGGAPRSVSGHGSREWRLPIG